MVAKRIKLDFSKVEERSGWNTNIMPEGLHEFKIIDVVDGEAQDGTDMFIFSLKPTASRFAARNFPFYCKLQPNQYWKLRDLLIAAGIPVPKKLGNVDPNKAIGKLIACEVTDATGKYEGRSEINGVYGLDVLDGESGPAGEDEDEEYEGEDESEEDEVDEDEAEEDGEEDELREELEGLTLVELRKRAKGLELTTTGLKKDDLVELIIEEELAEPEEDEDEDELDDEDLEDEELEDEEFEDDEDEEEEPEPVKPARRAPARKPAAKAAPAAAGRRVVRRR